MLYTTLVSVPDLHTLIQTSAVRIVDCRFDLKDTEAGRHAYLEGHIPGALYAHLDEDLSGPILPGQTGRHPLPAPDAFAATLSRLGIAPGQQVVAYDERGGPFAARLWWMLRWMGHDAVAVLDGGWPAWIRAGHSTHTGTESVQVTQFGAAVRQEMTIDSAALLADQEQHTLHLLDARAGERYRGEVEPLDPVAGHIPGATSAPFDENLNPDLTFKTSTALRARFETLLKGDLPGKTVCYCGSGVTAAHNLLAMAHAGFKGARLYPGSWSHWITDPSRPIETG